MAINRIDYDTCVGCGNCVKTCGPDVLRMDKELKKPVIAYPEDCISCCLCVRYCPVNALYIPAYMSAPLTVNCG